MRADRRAREDPAAEGASDANHHRGHSLLRPELHRIDQSKPTLLPALALAIARAATNQAGAVWLLSEPGPDALFVFHGLPGQVRAVADKRQEPAYAFAVQAAWQFH